MIFLTSIGVLFILYITYFIGRRIGSTVPDEIEPSRTYLMMVPDVLLLIMTGLLLVGYGWGIQSMIAILLLMVLRYFIPFKKSYSIVSGSIIAVGFFLSTELFATLGILCLLLNYLVGALAKNTRDAAVQGLGQPIAGFLVITIITLLV